jgi:CheY-like chemotaxis protein
MTPTQPNTTAAVLIVDDVPKTAALHSAVLGQLGHRIRVARTDAEALAGLADSPPDAAILDLDVGRLTAERLEHATKRPLLIVLLKPGSAQRYTREQLSSFDYVFFKAVSPEVLAQKITKFMADRTGQYKPLKD